MELIQRNNGSPPFAWSARAQGAPAARVSSIYHAFLFCTPEQNRSVSIGDTFLTPSVSSSPADIINNVHLPSSSPHQGSKETLRTTRSGAGVWSSLFPPPALITFTPRGEGRDCPTTDPLRQRSKCKRQLTDRCTTFHAAIGAEII